MNNECYFCGEEIPEGRMICPACQEADGSKAAKARMCDPACAICQTIGRLRELCALVNGAGKLKDAAGMISGAGTVKGCLMAIDLLQEKCCAVQCGGWEGSVAAGLIEED